MLFCICIRINLCNIARISDDQAKTTDLRHLASGFSGRRSSFPTSTENLMNIILSNICKFF